MKNKIMRVFYAVAGGHTHIAIWTGNINCTLGKAGELTITNEEFEAWKNGSIILEFVKAATNV